MNRVDAATAPSSEVVAIEETFEDLAVVRIAPLDLSTDFVGEPEVLVTRSGLSEADIVTISGAVSLVSLPLGTPIPVEVEHLFPALGTSEHRFVLHPRRRLGVGWYEARCDLAALPFATDASQSAVGQRFHVGSLPIVVGPVFSPGDDALGVMVWFSERIHDPRENAELVEVWQGGRRLPCTSGPGDGVRNPAGALGVNVVCPLVPLDEEITVLLADGMRSVAGAELQAPFDGSPRELRVTPAASRSLSLRPDLVPPRVAEEVRHE